MPNSLFCHANVKALPCRWQMFAMRMAQPCHADGKTLPTVWQTLAKGIKRHISKQEGMTATGSPPSFLPYLLQIEAVLNNF